MVAPSNQNTPGRAGLIHREIVQLAVLIVVAVGGFVLTRTVAASNRRINLQDGVEWFERGQQQLDAGRVNDAAESFRRAAVRNRNEKRYVLALARALTLAGDDTGARKALLELRESTPEDADINLQLARLSAGLDDVEGATRYYHNALYAPWPAEQAVERREVRFELVRFLISHQQAERARSELLALGSDLPAEGEVHLRVAQLAARAGDSRQALEQFESALRFSPGSGDALAGAGLSAFQLGDYALARKYLRSAPGDSEGVRSTRELVELVLANDPLSSRLGAAERARRLRANFSYALMRLTGCLEQGAAPQAADAPALLMEAQALEKQWTAATLREQDTLESGVDMVARLAGQIARSCQPETPLDRALVLIGREHGS